MTRVPFLIDLQWLLFQRFLTSVLSAMYAMWISFLKRTTWGPFQMHLASVLSPRCTGSAPNWRHQSRLSEHLELIVQQRRLLRPWICLSLKLQKPLQPHVVSILLHSSFPPVSWHRYHLLLDISSQIPPVSLSLSRFESWMVKKLWLWSFWKYFTEKFTETSKMTYTWSKNGLYGDPFGIAMPNPEGNISSGTSAAWQPDSWMNLTSIIDLSARKSNNKMQSDVI